MAKAKKDKEKKVNLTGKVRESVKARVVTWSKVNRTSLSAAVDELLEHGLSVQKTAKTAAKQQTVICENCGHQWQTKSAKPRCSKCHSSKVKIGKARKLKRA